MNRATRDKFASGTQKLLTSGNACWETPPLVYAKLHAETDFQIDLTGDAQRHLCPIWFGPDSNVGEFDALSAGWLSHGTRGYSNPPYGPFVQTMLLRAKTWAMRGFTSKLLLPMRATKAFHAHILSGATDLLFCDTRITFFEDGVPRLNKKAWEKGKVIADPAMFDSIIVIFQPMTSIRPLRAAAWDVPLHVTKDDLNRAAERRRERERTPERHIEDDALGEPRSIWESA